MIFAGILAGGSGSRMQAASLPKQFIQMSDKPIMIHTIERFLAIDDFACIYIGINPAWSDYFLNLLEQYLPQQRARLEVVCGDSERYSTLDCIVRSIEASHGHGHAIVTHDAVRPFVSREILCKHVKLLSRHEVINTVIPATDTIVESEDGKLISRTLQRELLYHCQTPQSFQIDSYREIFNDLTAAEREGLTDACQVFTLRDIPVAVVKGDINNFKITTKLDLQLAELIYNTSSKPCS